MTHRKQLPPHRRPKTSALDPERIIAERITAAGVRWQVRCPKADDPDDVCDYIRIVWFDPNSDDEHEQECWNIGDWRDDPTGQGIYTILLNIKVMLNR